MTDKPTLDPQTDLILRALSEQTQAALKQAKAEEERIKVEQERIKVEQRRLREEQNKTQLLWVIFERYANLGEQVTGQIAMVNSLIEAVNSLFAFSEWFEELSDRFENIEYNQRLSLEILRLIAPQARDGGKEKLAQIIRDIDQGPQIVGLRRRLPTLYRRLEKLQEQKALKGSDATPALLIEIENTEVEISEAEAELQSLIEDD